MSLSQLTYYDYTFLGIIGIIMILFLFIDLRKLIKIIISNYIIIVIVLGFVNISESIDAIKNLITIPVNINMSNINDLKTSLSENKNTMIPLLYFLTLAIVFSKSHFSLGIGDNRFKNFISKLIFSPLTTINILITLEILFYGNLILYAPNIMKLADSFTDKISIRYFTMLTPIWLILPGLITMLYSISYDFISLGGGSSGGKSGFSLKFRGKKKNTGGELHSGHDDHGHGDHGSSDHGHGDHH